LQNLKNYLQENSLKFIVMAVIVVAAIATVVVYRNKKTESIQNAGQILSGARTPQDLQSVVQKHDSTPYAPLAMLKLAKMHFNAGDYSQALTQYVEFQKKYPTHPMVDGAELGRVYCLEAQGQTEEALKGFVAFLTAHPDHFLSSQAMFGQARCLEQMGRDLEAKAVYEDFIVAHPDSPWTIKAKELLAVIVKKLKGGKDDSDLTEIEKEAPKPTSEGKSK
jgi:TolA-binding protein